jgi:hypothetical protein
MKILVLVCSYLDEQLRSTIINCAENSSDYKNLRFAVILQHDHHDANVIDDLPYDITVEKYHHTESKGVGWARNKAAALYNGEDYVLQIDSHSRLIRNWDTILLANMANLNSKSIISFLPPSYIRELKLGVDIYYKNINQLSVIQIPKAQTFMGDWLFWYGGYDNEKDTHGKNIRVPVTYGGFIFAPGSWIEQVPPDSDLYYWGEEQSVFLRTFTHGWDIYLPSQIVCWHYSSSKNNPPPPMQRKVVEEQQLTDLINASKLKTEMLIKNQVEGKYGLGTERTMQEWIEFSGVDFFNKVIHNRDYV